MRGLARGVAPAFLAGLIAACGGEGGGSAPASPAARGASSSAFEEAKRLVDAGDPEAALAALKGAPEGAENLYVQGLAWAKKAETAPLPTPPPAPSPLPRGYVPEPAPEWKAEERQAVSLLEEAVALAPGHARARLALAELLGPHALRRIEEGKAAAAASRGRKGKAVAPPPPPDPSGPDASPERILREYRAAVEADPASVAPLEALIAFGERTGRTAEAEWALQELLKREREKPGPFIRYGDYLRARGDIEGAIVQYRQALIWKADDPQTRDKIGEIYIVQAEGHLAKQEWAAADQRLKDAEKWVDKSSATGRRLQAAQAQLRQIRR